MNMYTRKHRTGWLFNSDESPVKLGLKKLLMEAFRASLLAGLVLSGTVGAKAASVSAPEFVDLVNESDYIVRAVVKTVTSHYAQPSSKKIVTKVEMEVIEVIAGKPPEPLVLQVLGGKVGQEEMIVDGSPQFKEGDEGIYFVQNNGRQISPLVAMTHGLYPIKKQADTNREYVTRSNAVPLQNAAEVALPITAGSVAEMQARMISPSQALTPAEFVQQIKAAVKPSNPRLNEK